MIIPVGYAHVVHFFGGDACPTGAAITYGVDLGATLDPSIQAEDCHNALVDNVMPNMPPDLTLLRTLCKFGPNDVGPSGEYTTPAVGGGSDVTGGAAISLLVQKKTGLGGREGRGRLYMPGLGEGSVDPGGDVVSANLAVFQTNWDAFLTEIETVSNGMVLLHNSLTAPTPVSSLVLSGVVATQRRRQRR